MNRAWAIGVAVALAGGLAALILIDPARSPLSPEARAMHQLRDASIRQPEVRFLRPSPSDDGVVCGLAQVGGSGGGPREAYFVSTREHIIVGRIDNRAVRQAIGRHCRGVFPSVAQAASDAG